MRLVANKHQTNFAYFELNCTWCITVHMCSCMKYASDMDWLVISQSIDLVGGFSRSAHLGGLFLLELHHGCSLLVADAKRYLFEEVFSPS